MTLEERKAAFTEELLLLLEKYRLGMFGGCVTEGIYGEVEIFDIDNPVDESNLEKYYRTQPWEIKFREIYEAASTVYFGKKYPRKT